MREFYEVINEYPWTTLGLFIAIFYIVGALAWGFKKDN